MSDNKPQAQKPGGKKTPMSDAGRKPGRGLGRGLSALIGDAAPTPVAVVPPIEKTETAAAEKQGGLRYVGIDQLSAGAFQPRKNFAQEELDALAASVEKSGVLQPLLVRPAGDGFEIIAGERRWRAAQQARLHQVPVIVQPVNDVTALEIGLVENVQRADLNPMEEAEGYQRLIDEFAYTQAELAETIGKSRSHIANLLRLTGAPLVIKQALMEGGLSMGHARALLGLANPEKQAAALIRQIVKTGMSVRAVEKLVAAQGASAPAKAPSAKSGAQDKSADTRQLEKQLADALGLAVSLDDKGQKGGVLNISYKTLEQLDGLIARLLRG